jgi:hypothetical protein
MVAAGLENNTVAPDGLDHGPTLSDCQAQWFFAVNILAGLCRHNHRYGMPVVRGSNTDSVNVVSGQKLAKIEISRASFKGAGFSILFYTSARTGRWLLQHHRRLRPAHRDWT